jgi:exodeoxyribonuclease X
MSRKARVMDLETTGFPEDAVKGICEIGFTDVDIATLSISPTTDFLINPGHPIPPQTRAVHHISDHDVRNAPPADVGFRILMKDMGEDDVFVAHNYAFEQAFFAGGGRSWICTMQSAKHVWPDAPGYSNHALRYWLDVDRDFDPWEGERAMPPHRAGPDTFVTAHIFVRLLAEKSVEELITLSKTPVVMKGAVRFGKHKGTDWRDLPWDYLDWIAKKSDMDEETKFTARHYLKVR